MNYSIFIVLVIELVAVVRASTGKIVNFGPKLTELIEQHPDKSWLIKFYVPWCYHCQQLEPIFVNVAEHIYHMHDNLIVGRVDCTKYSSVCDKYDVRSYPKIAYLNKNTHITYKGDRSAKTMIEFAERLNGPDILFLKSCNELQDLIANKELIVLYADMSDKFGLNLFETFKTTAKKQKSRYWFYQIKDYKDCKQYKIDTSSNGVYIVKKGLNRAIRFDTTTEITNDVMAKTLADWIDRNSLPIYGPIGSSNLDRYLSDDKSLVIAILDEYQPAKKFSHSSRHFNEQFGEFVQKYVQSNKYENDFIFGFTSDLDLIRNIIIGEVSVPNVMILRKNFTYHLFIQDEKDLNKKTESINLPTKLEISYLKAILLSPTKLNKLTYMGGNSYLQSLLRQMYGQYNVYVNMYRANPLLASILVGLPSVILAFVIYTTCFYDSSNGSGVGDEEDDNYDDNDIDYDDQYFDQSDKNNQNKERDDNEMYEEDEGGDDYDEDEDDDVGEKVDRERQRLINVNHQKQD